MRCVVLAWWYIALLAELCYEKHLLSPRGSGCRTVGWLVMSILLCESVQTRVKTAIVVPGLETWRSIVGIGRCNLPLQSPLGAFSFSSACYNFKRDGVKLVLIRYFSLLTRTKSTSPSPLLPSCPPLSLSPIAPFPPHRLQGKTTSE